MAPRKKPGRRGRQPSRRNGNNGMRNNNAQPRVTVRTRNRVNRADNNMLSNTGNIVRPLVEQPTCMKGSDFLGTVSVKAGGTGVESHILHDQLLSPSLLNGTRVQALAGLWERYRFRSAVLRWVPAVPNTFACQFIVYVDTDPADDPSKIPTVQGLFRNAMSQSGAQQFNFIHPRAIELARRSDKQLYYTGLTHTNVRFNAQGRVFVIQVTTPIGFDAKPLDNGTVVGSLYLDWDIEFQIAQINPIATLPGTLYEHEELVDNVRVVEIGTHQTKSVNFGSVTVNGPTGSYINLAAAALHSIYDNVKISTSDLTTLLTQVLKVGGTQFYSTVTSWELTSASAMKKTYTHEESKPANIYAGHSYLLEWTGATDTNMGSLYVTLASILYRWQQRYGAVAKFNDAAETERLLREHPEQFHSLT